MKKMLFLTAVAAAAQQDYKVNGAKRGWMSKNGKLYGYYDGCYITPVSYTHLRAHET